MFLITVVHVFINLVRQNNQVIFDRDLGDFLKIGFRDHASAGIVWGVDDQKLRAWSDQ
jgi:hypothetical protein